jgi:hypothetical protein
VKRRFVQWVIDTCARPRDAAWLNYQEEIGLRHILCRAVSYRPPLHKGLHAMINRIHVTGSGGLHDGKCAPGQPNAKVA